MQSKEGKGYKSSQFQIRDLMLNLQKKSLTKSAIYKVPI